MISKNDFERLKKYQDTSSWCVWEKWNKEDKEYASNLYGKDNAWREHMSWAKDEKNLIKKIKTSCIFVALNASGKPDDGKANVPWSNFHSGKNDYVLRYALWDDYYGSYITDIIKYEDVKKKQRYREISSSAVRKKIEDNPAILRDNIQILNDEIAILKDVEIIIALGRDAYDFLIKAQNDKWLSENIKIVYMLHYSYRFVKGYYKKKEYGNPQNISRAECYKRIFMEQLKEQGLK